MTESPTASGPKKGNEMTGKRYPLKSETYRRISAAQEPVPPLTDEQVAGSLRVEIARISQEIITLADEMDSAATQDEFKKMAKSIKIKLDTQARLIQRLTDMTGGKS